MGWTESKRWGWTWKPDGPGGMTPEDLDLLDAIRRGDRSAIEALRRGPDSIAPVLPEALALGLDPFRHRAEVVAILLGAVGAGRTLRQAAALAGVHAATVCRWQALSPPFKAALGQARAEARRAHRAARPPAPAVPIHPACPSCGAAVEVRAAGPGIGPRFWRCSTWPACSWASWRPRHPEDCPGCGGPRFWSHSRKSVRCPGCGRCEVAERPVETAPHFAASAPVGS